MNQNQQTYLPPTGYVLMMMPTAPAVQQEEPKKDQSDHSGIIGIFWAIGLAFAFWFITGGWEQVYR